MAKEFECLMPPQFTESVAHRIFWLEKILGIKQKSLESAPPGLVRIVRKKRTNQFYLRENDSDLQGKYIPLLFSENGERVRSKSEVIIADILKNNGIPYRYEYPVLINRNIHPDFCCLNVRTRKEYFWEHFGKMDDIEYARQKLERTLKSESSDC